MSPVYVDLRIVVSYPDILHRVAGGCWVAVVRTTNLLGGPLVATTAAALGWLSLSSSQ